MTLLEILFACLCPAGSGVFTVHAGKHVREPLQYKMYGGVGDVAISAWQHEVKHKLKKSKTMLLGLPSDNGGGILRGANWGPLYLRERLYASLEMPQLLDLGDVRVIPQLLLDEYLSESLIESCRAWLYQDAHSMLPVSPLSIALYVLSKLFDVLPGIQFFGIGGDHSCSYPFVKAYLKHKKTQHKRTALIQFDAHTDVMKDRMGVPICFGSWVYHILNDLPGQDCLVQIGIRSTGKTRDYWHQAYGFKQYWAFDVIENGAKAVASDLIEYLRQKQIDEIYITFDIDALDAAVASATGTPEADGLSLQDAETIITTLAEHFHVTGADMMEVAPLIYHRYPISVDAFEKTLAAALHISQLLISLMSVD